MPSAKAAGGDRVTIKRLNNKKGAALVTALMITTILLGLTICLSFASVGEVQNANRFRDSTSAFWAAEGAVQRFLQDTTMLDDADQTVTIGTHSVFLSKDDSDPVTRVVTATGTANGITRSIEVTFPAIPPSLFDNTMSSGGGVTLDGFIAGIDVDGKTRLSGVYDDQGFITNATFEDKEEAVSGDLTTLEYPDADENGTADEFSDFVAYNRQFVDPDDPNYTGEYTADEVLHIEGNDTVNIWPDADLADKKIIFVEGSAPGEGDVNIWFDSSWQADQNVTVISTGSVNYIQPLQNPSADSQLNTISWDNYNEAAILFSSHSGVTYTHAEANYGSIISLSKTEGNLIANDDVNLDLILVWKEFDYENPVDDEGLVPPAFQGLVGGASDGYSSDAASWTEI